MEAVLKELATGDEDKITISLKNFNEANTSNYKLGESAEVRERFCGVLLSNFSALKWSPAVTLLGLNALRIFTREHEGSSDLLSPLGLTPLIHLAGLDRDYEAIQNLFTTEKVSADGIGVMVEAVKCLCNIVLNNHPLANTVSDLGCLASLKNRLAFSSTYQLPFDMVFFDLRLMFLITACGPDQRVKLRDELDGPYVMVTLLDSILFGVAPEPPKLPDAEQTRANQEATAGVKAAKGSPSKAEAGGEKRKKAGAPSEEEDVVKSKKQSVSLDPMRDGCFVLKSEISEKTCMLICEALKIIFSQTVNWKSQDDFEENEIELFTRLAHLLRIMICTIPLFHGKITTQTLNHCCEVIMNMPQQCHHLFLIPPDETITPALKTLYPTLFEEPQGEQEKAKALHCCDFDPIVDEQNVGMAVCLLNSLNSKLTAEEFDRHGLSIVLGAMTLLSKGNRTIRRFLKAQILPPLHEVKERPESANSLKGRLVRLMTAGPHDCMDMVAEFLFVLCKESASRLVKHTGYGNAAGLLMSHGLLGGGRFQGQDDYSDDSGCSETEEYQHSKGTIDPVTGGPSKPAESPLDHMTPEEIELEAEKLGTLFNQLQDQGMFKLIPMDKDNNPVEFPKSDEEGKEDKDQGPHCSKD